MRSKNINKKLVVIFGVMFLFLLFFLAITIYSTNNSSTKFSQEIVMIKLPQENIIFESELQNPNIKLQDQNIIISKKYLDNFFPYSEGNNIDNNNINDTQGLIICKKYTFYENTRFRQKKLGQFEIIQRHSRKNIREIIDNNTADNVFDISFEIGSKDFFGFLFQTENNNRMTIMHYADDKSIEAISRKLVGQYSKLSYDITILIGIYEPYEPYTEKRHLFPYYKTTDINIIFHHTIPHF
jgi:hypothetical protein